MNARILARRLAGSALLAWGGTAAAAEWFLVPELSLEAGFQNNRMLTASSVTNSEDSAFLRTTPALSLRALADDGWELALLVRHAATAYAQREQGDATATEASLEAWHSGPRWIAGSVVDAAILTDDAMPEDDRRRAGLAPSVEFHPPDRAGSLTARARIDMTEYDHLETSKADALRERFAEIRPGLQWILRQDARLWIEIYGEDSDANESGFDYRGAGATVGAELEAGPRGRLSAWLQAGTRAFDESGTDTDRHDAPLAAGAAFRYRLFPGLDLAASATWQATRSNIPEQDLSVWSVQAGLVLTDEWILSRPARPARTSFP